MNRKSSHVWQEITRNLDRTVVCAGHSGARLCCRGPWRQFQTGPEGPRFHIPRQDHSVGAIFQRKQGWRLGVPVLDLRRGSPAPFPPHPRRGRQCGRLCGWISLQPGQPVAGADAKIGIWLANAVLVSAEGQSFFSRDTKPLADLAWDYFFTTPTSKGMHRDPKNLYGLDHAFVALVKGMEENYAWMGEHWPDSRYVVVSLSFDMQGEDIKAPWIEDWHCVYDLKTGKFSVPPEFAEDNAKAVTRPKPK